MFFAAIGIACVTAAFVMFSSQRTPSAWQDVKSAVAEAERLLKTDDYPAFLKNAVPPSKLKQILEKRSFDEFVVQFKTRKAARLRKMLEAAKELEPVYDDNRTMATFNFPRDVSGENSISFTKIENHWYVANKSKVRGTTSGSLAPHFIVETTDGRQIDSEKLRGKIIVLHFWATWCGPCVRQMPDHIDFLAEYDEKDVEVIFVCMNGDEDGIAESIVEYSIPYSTVLGPDGWSGYGVDLLPMDVVIDHEGIIASNSIKDIPRLLGGDG